MSLGSFVGVMLGVKRVCPGDVCMMGCFFVLAALVVLSRFGVVTRRMRMVLGCFLRHCACSFVALGLAPN